MHCLRFPSMEFLFYCHRLWLTFFPGRSLDKVKADAQEKGDLGLVAEVAYKLFTKGNVIDQHRIDIYT